LKISISRTKIEQFIHEIYPHIMTPFGLSLLELRQVRRLRQKELAGLLRIDPSYLSGLESGRKGPPSKALVKRVQAVLGLNDAETLRLEEAADLSRRKYEIPVDAEPAEYRLVSTLMNRVGHLKPAQINAMAEILKL
jgi:HTH-type transcriptional regulator, competence development regulator